MEIHKPKPIHSWREFVSELGTIVLGIIIALSLEAAVEAHHNADKVEHARADFRTELKSNREKLVQDLVRERDTQSTLEQLLAFAQARSRHEKASMPIAHSVSRSFVQLSESAWRTALSTDVMVHFPHEEARLVSEAYSEQEAFAAIEQTAERAWFELAAFDVSEFELADSDVQLGARQLRISFAYLISLQDAEQRLLQAYDAVLLAAGSK